MYRSARRIGAILLSGCAAATALPLGSMLGSPNASALNVYHTTGDTPGKKQFFRLVVKTNVVGQTSGFSLLGVVTIVPAKFTKAMNRLLCKRWRDARATADDCQYEHQPRTALI